jgi:hypothetical protein
MLLAAIVAVVLSAAATGLVASPSDSHSAKGTLGKGELGKNKDFSGLVDIGGGRKMYMECHGRGGSHGRARIRRSRRIRRLDPCHRLRW